MKNSCMVTYLNEYKTNNIPVKVYLIGGTLLQGYIKDIDDDSLVLDQVLINFTNVLSIKPRD